MRISPTRCVSALVSWRLSGWREASDDQFAAIFRLDFHQPVLWANLQTQRSLVLKILLGTKPVSLRT